MTVLTCVCCSMISDTQTRYGVRSRCHGRSWRPYLACQAMSTGASADSRNVSSLMALDPESDSLQLRIGKARALDDDLSLRVDRAQSVERQLEGSWMRAAHVRIGAKIHAVGVQVER